MPGSPSLTELLRTRGAKGTRILEPGRIVSYDEDDQSCSVQPLLKRQRIGEYGDVIVENQPIINHVPVVFEGGGGYGTTYPVAAGDVVAIFWASRSLDLWLARGGLIDPEDARTNHISDAVVFTGLYDFAHPRSSAPTDCATFGKIGGPRIEAAETEIRIGGAGGEPTILADTYRSAENDLIDAIGVFSSALAALVPGGAALAVTLQDVIDSFKLAGGTYKTQIAKVL